MKAVKSVVVVFIGLLFLAGCKGSESIQGKWYAVNSDNQKIIITFDEKTGKFSTEDQEDWTFDYVQTGTGFQNSASYKVLKWEDQSWTFVFPDKKDKENAVILMPYSDDEKLNGDVYWILSRTEYPDYDEYREDDQK